MKKKNYLHFLLPCLFLCIFCNIQITGNAQVYGYPTYLTGGGINIFNPTPTSVTIQFPFYDDYDENSAERFISDDGATLSYSTNGRNGQYTSLVHVKSKDQDIGAWYRIYMTNRGTEKLTATKQATGYGEISDNGTGRLITSTSLEMHYNKLSGKNVTYAAIHWDFGTQLNDKVVYFKLKGYFSGTNNSNVLKDFEWISSPFIVGNPIHPPTIASHTFNPNGSVDFKVDITGYNALEDDGIDTTKGWIGIHKATIIPAKEIESNIAKLTKPVRASNILISSKRPLADLNLGFVARPYSLRVDNGNWMFKYGDYYTVPPYPQPYNLSVQILEGGKLKLEWSINNSNNESIFDGFHLQWARGGEDWTKDGKEIDLTQISFVKNKTTYTAEIDYPDTLNKGIKTFWYRLKRSGLDWISGYYTEKSITINTNKTEIGSISTTISVQNQIQIKWNLSTGITDNTWKFKISRIKKDGAAVVLSSDIPFATREYTDVYATECDPVTYKVELLKGTTVETSLSSTIPIIKPKSDIGSIVSLSVSKGYYNDQVRLRWKVSASSGFARFTITRKEQNIANTTEEQITNSIEASGSTTEYLYTDLTAVAGTYYEYTVRGIVNCDGVENAASTASSIGFSQPFGVVSGRISYEGSTAVEGVSVVATGTGTISNKAMGFTPSQKTYIKTPYKANMLSPTEFTFQAWIKNAINSSQGRAIMTFWGRYNVVIQLNGTLSLQYFENNGRHNGSMLFDYIIPSQEFHHVTITAKRDSANNTAEVILYVDGQAKDSINNNNLLNAFATNFNTTAFTRDGTESTNFGRGDGDNWYFDGSMDEVRLWKKALSPKEIAQNYDRYLSGQEDGLALYYRFDEIDGKDVFDLSSQNSVYNENHGVIYGGDNSLRTATEVPSSVQLGIKAITDANGHYLINTIPYFGEGSQYTITPLLGVHQFNPSNKPLFFSQASSTHNNVDFTDVSSFEVSGNVYYENTRFPVEGANIYVDGNMTIKNGEPIATNTMGQFTINVPIGKHFIEVKKAGHVFAQGGRFPTTETYTFNQPLTIKAPFYDSTKVRVIGRVTGGPVEGSKDLGFNLSKNNVGESLLVLQAKGNKKTYPLMPTEDKATKIIAHEKAGRTKMVHQTSLSAGEYEITITPDSLTGEFFADLIPENFDVITVQAGTNKDNSAFMLPAEQLFPIDLATAAGVKNYLTRNLTDSITVFDEQSQKYIKKPKQDSVFYGGVTKKYIRRSTPEISVTNIATNKIADTLFGEETVSFTNPVTQKPQEIAVINKTTKKYTINNLPVFKMGNPYKLQVAVFENYINSWTGTSSKVPVTDGNLIINNDLARTIVEYIKLDTSGKAVYEFLGGNPSLSIVPADGKNNHTRSFNITAATGDEGMIKTNWKPENNPLKGYLLGAAVTGSNFTTRGPKNILTVLRDPPGSTSSATFENTSTLTQERSIEAMHGLDAKIMVEWVAGAKVSAGLGVIYETLESENSLGAGIETTHHWTSGNTWTSQTTFTQKYNTSDMNIYVGGMADVLVGYSENVVFSEAKTLNIYDTNALPNGIVDGTRIELGNGYCFAQRNAIDVSPEFETHFLYTTTGIETKIIPDLRKLRNALIYPSTVQSPDPNILDRNVYFSTVPIGDEKFGENGSYGIKVPTNATFANNTDSVALYNKDIDGWKKALADNEKDKLNAFIVSKVSNISFEAGSSYERSVSVDSTHRSFSSYDYTADIITTGNTLLEIASIGFRLNCEGKAVNSGKENNVTDSSKTKVYSFKLSDDNPGDFYTVDVFDSPNGWGPVFRTRGGQTSCPYEEAVYAKYHEPEQKHLLSQATAQIEKPRITIEPATRSNVPGNKAAIYTLVLENESETNTDVVFLIKVNESTNPDGAILAIDGLPIGNGRNMLVPAGTKTYKTLSLMRSKEDIFDYKDIEIELQSLCQCRIDDYYPNIKSVAKISAYFTPSCGNISLKSPVNGFIVNQVQMDINNTRGLKGILPIVISDFDVNNNALKTITLYYKASTESDDAWKMLGQYAKTPTQTQKKLEGSSLSYNWVMKDEPNRSYHFKAVASGAGAETSETAIITVIKDDKSPKVFGKPQPASGILSAEQDISISFDEEIDQSLILPELHGNIQVNANLPGYAVQHGTGVSFNGTNGYMTVPNKVNLNNTFTIDFWLKRDQMNTREVVLSHGESVNFVEFGFTADNKVFVKTVKGELTSTNTVDATVVQDTWAHIGLAFDGQKLSVYVNSSNYISKNDMTPYSSMSVLTLGRNLNAGEYYKGKVHELRIWTKSLDVSDNAVYRNITLTGKEPNLYSNWKMNEAFGTVAKDKVRSRDAVMSAVWFVEPVGKAKALDGANQYVSVPLKNILSDDDYTVEMWFKGNNTQTLPATLMATGSGMTGSNKRNQFNLYFNNSGKLTFDADSISTPIGNENYLDNQWHHVAVAVNHTGNVTFYVDGVNKAYRLGTTVGGLSGESFSLAACKHATGVSSYFKGQIDEFRYWRMYRNQELINMHRTSKLQGTEAGLTAYYPFEKKDGNFIIDNNNNSVSDTTLKNEVTSFIGNVSTVEGAAIKTAATIENIPFTWALNKDKLVISLTERDDYVKRMENATLTISVKDLYDKYGNPSAATSWTAYVDKNQLRWSEPEMNFTVKQGEGLTFEVLVSNTGGSVQDFTITQVPSWLEISTTSGKVQPRSSVKITFKTSKELGIGNYEQQLYLNGALLSDMFKVRVKVAAQKPDWTVTPADFANSMSVIGQVKIDDNFSSDQEDLVAAFMGDKCVGVASPKYMKEYDSYYLFMDVYGDSVGAITFNIWDASSGSIYPKVNTNQLISFEADRLYGSINSPVIFNAQSNVIEQDISLKTGWNWVSFNVHNANFDDFGQTFASLGNAVDQIKGHTMFKQHENELWSGSLDSVETAKMYNIKMKSAAMLKMTGVLANPANYPVSLSKNWNWIGYVPQQSMSVNEALAGLNPTEGDVIKGQSNFAMYTATNGWVGTLEYLQPGKGYKYKADKASTFYYPANVVNQSMQAAPMMLASMSMYSNHWSFEPSTYQLNMTMVAVLYKDGVECKNADYEIGAFDKNNVCRGNIVLRKNTSNDCYFAYLTIMGETSGEALTLKAYNANDAKEYTILQTITFAPDAMLGTATNPYVLSIGSTATVNQVNHKVYTAGDSVKAVQFTGNCIPGTCYQWKSTGNTVGLPMASGVNATPTFIAVNTGTTALVTTITVTPVSVVGKDSVKSTPMLFNITVNPIPAGTVTVSGISLNKTSTTLIVGGEETLFANITPTNATNQNVSWTSSDTAVAKISTSGKVTAVKAGTATITVTTEDGNKTATCLVTVTNGTGIEDIEAYTQTLKVYPNPVTNGKLIIETDCFVPRNDGSNPTTSLRGGTTKQSPQIELYNLTGQLVATYSITGNKTELDITLLPAGTYLVKVGNEVVKVVKQ